MRVICVLAVLALLAFMGCKEKAEAQKPVADTTKVVAPAPEVKAPEAVKVPEVKAPEAKPTTSTPKSKKK
jgi:uncharacterized lipoprotein